MLGNLDPSVQLEVINQIPVRPRFVVLDTMNFWMDIALDKLKEVLQKVDVLTINDEEARQLAQEYSLVKAAAKIMAMGDFNDDPTDPSLKKILQVKGKKNELDSLSLYGPMEQMFKKGAGSLAYRDKWNLFDQIYMTANLVQGNPTEFNFWKAGIFTPTYLLDPKGQYKGYPLRTYAGGAHIGGYSDHFPVYVYLLRKYTTD
jgi:hypothetical protein